MKFPFFKDDRGFLVPFEFSELPFVPKRSYVLSGTKNAVRGGHAHIIEQELFVCVAGSVTLKLVSKNSDGKKEDQLIRLDSPENAVYIPTMVWHELFDFSPDARVLAFSSVAYTPGDKNYITDFQAFLEN